jgi:hypothetical protein
MSSRNWSVTDFKIKIMISLETPCLKLSLSWVIYIYIYIYIYCKAPACGKQEMWGTIIEWHRLICIVYILQSKLLSTPTDLTQISLIISHYFRSMLSASSSASFPHKGLSLGYIMNSLFKSIGTIFPNICTIFQLKVATFLTRVRQFFGSTPGGVIAYSLRRSCWLF